MTKENREKAYLHFRNSEKNYVAPEGKNHDLTATSVVRKHCKELADALLKKNPELAELEKAPEKLDPPQDEPKALQENKPKSNSKGKKGS